MYELGCVYEWHANTYNLRSVTSSAKTGNQIKSMNCKCEFKSRGKNELFLVRGY